MRVSIERLGLVACLSVIIVVLGSWAVFVRVANARPATGDVSSEKGFTNNGDGTVTDRTTGLTWIPKLRIEAKSLAEATALCPKVEYGGRKDWRLPTKEELVDLIVRLKPEKDAAGFSAVAKAKARDLFWTSSLHVQDAKKQGGIVLENLGPNPFVQTVTPDGSVIIHGGAEVPGVYVILVRDKASPAKNTKTDADRDLE